MARVEVSARIGSMIVRACSALGADGAALAREVGFDPAIAADPDARIPVETEDALWDGAATRLGDPLFGLHAARLLQPGVFDVLDYAIRTAPTLRAALDRLVRYNRLVHSAAVFEVSEVGDRIRIEHAFATPGHRPSRQASEFTLASLIVIGGQLIGKPLHALAVDLPHPEESRTRDQLAAVFGVGPRFDAAVGAIELARADVDRTCPAADPMLSEVILRQANALLASRPDPTAAFATRVRGSIVSRLGETDVTLGSIARDLKMSERSVQRRLADEGITFDALVDELRRELALRYLATPTMAIGEVAYLLGYSEPSAFHRAFKRWTGRTPTEARAQS